MYLSLMHHLIKNECIEHVSRTAHTFELGTIVLFVRYLLNSLFIYTVSVDWLIHSNFRELSTSTVLTVGLLIFCLPSLFHHYIRSRRVLYYPNQSDWCCYYNCSVQNQRCCGRNGWFVHLIWMVRKRPKIFTSVFVKILYFQRSSCCFGDARWLVLNFRGFPSFCEDSKTVECIYSVVL